jgi:hypothetical protein
MGWLHALAVCMGMKTWHEGDEGMIERCNKVMVVDVNPK